MWVCVGVWVWCTTRSSTGHDDLELNSALGRADGNVYEALLEWAKDSPLNAGAVVEGWDERYGEIVRMGRKSLEVETGKSLADYPGIIQQPPSMQRAHL
jgi:hypothetical protein